MYSRLIRPALARAAIRVKAHLTAPLEFFMDIALTGVDLLAYVYTYRFLGMPKEFATFVMIGGILNAYWLYSVWAVGVNTYWEKAAGNLQRFMICPAPLPAIIVGSALGVMPIASGILLVVSFLGWILKVPAHFGNLPLLVFTFLTTVFAMLGMGVLFSTLFLITGREGWFWGSLLEEPVFFSAGVYYPIKFLPGFVKAIGCLVPLTFGIDAVRQIVVGKDYGWLPLKVEIGILCALVVGLFAFGIWLSGRLYWYARETGRLLDTGE